MKKIIILFKLLLVLFFIFSQNVPAAGQSQSILRVSPASVVLDPGQTATIEIVVELGEQDLLRAFSVEIHFDPAHLSANNLVQGDFLSTLLPAPGNKIDNELGTILFGVVQGPVEPVSGSGILFSFDIQAKDAPGLTTLEIVEAELVDADYFLIDAALQNGAVLINGDVNLTMSITPEGAGATTPAVGSHVFDAGAYVLISAAPAGGYRFENWTGDVAATIVDPETPSTTITVNGDTSITANFVRQYTLTLAVSPEAGGTIIPAVGSYVFDAGTVVELTATPADGYRFVDWSGDLDGVSDPYADTTAITMNGNTSITANFVRQYTLTTAVSPEGAGTTSPPVGTRVFDAGAVVDITAIAADGYRFINWTGDLETIADPYLATTTITMDGDTSITANFVRQYTLTMAVSPEGAGTITPAVGTHVFDAGSVIDIAAVPGIGYRFTNWSGDLETIADPVLATTTITMNGDTSITANFVQKDTPAILIYLPLVLR